MNRPGIQSIKRMIEAGEVKVVVIFKLERMSRNMDEWVRFAHSLSGMGVGWKAPPRTFPKASQRGG